MAICIYLQELSNNIGTKGPRPQPPIQQSGHTLFYSLQECLDILKEHLSECDSISMELLI